MMRGGAPEPTDKHVGARLRMRRLMLSMSQTTLANALNLTFQQVQKYEKRSNRIAAGRLHQIAGILQVPIELFFEGGPTPLGQGRRRKHDPAPDYVSGFLATSDGLSLTRAFVRIKEPGVRCGIVKLVQQIANDDG
jgi:transcriptional regulator with XRE-family HTH domain